jgi:hypothetical protein
VDGDMDVLVAEIALLVGDVRDQFLVNTAPDVRQIDRVHR